MVSSLGTALAVLPLTFCLTIPRDGNHAKSAPTATIYPKTGSCDAVDITVIKNGGFKQDAYLGIPFAAPPVGDLRFAPPQPVTWNTTSFTADKYGPACLQAPAPVYDQFGQSEDCLTLNVITPEGIDPNNESLPVMVWIYGGSFVTGAASIYNASWIMEQAMESGLPVIYVSINYRLGILGFPSGKDAAQAGAANLGLKDVMLSLDWVKDNIGAFGGDPGQVTIFAESAGAIMTSQLFLQQDEKVNFKGAIMESGAQSVTPIAPTAEFWQDPFDLILNFTNCSTPESTQRVTAAAKAAQEQAGNSSSSSSTGNNGSKRDDGDNEPFTCLRNVPADALMEAQAKVMNISEYSGAFIFAPSIDGDLISASPHDLLAEGKFLDRPFITGNNVDEGTLFVSPAIANFTQDELPTLIGSIEPAINNASVLAAIAKVYPNDPAVGAPYNTGNQTFDLPPQFKQLASIFGDMTFQSSRRWFLQHANQYGNQKSWSYLFGRPIPGSPPSLGITHAFELPYIYGIPQAHTKDLPPGASGIANDQYNGTFTAGDIALSKSMITYWLNFAYYCDPNGNGSTNITQWPNYGLESNTLYLDADNITVVADTYRQQQIEYFLDNPKTFNL